MLVSHRPFNLVKGIVIDAMHCVFLGVMAKTLIPLWCEPAHRLKGFSIRSQVSWSIKLNVCNVQA